MSTITKGVNIPKHGLVRSRVVSRTQRSCVMMKPDPSVRGLVGKIITKLETIGLQLVALKQMTPSSEQIKQHYVDLKDKPFFGFFADYMANGSIVVMVWKGVNAVSQVLNVLEDLNPQRATPIDIVGHLHGDFFIQDGRNICHGSDSVDSANREIAHWFKENEINEA